MGFAAPRAGARSAGVRPGLERLANGDVQIARREGRQLPPGIGVDRDGKPTTDPNAVLDGGALLPFGGHKGSSIAMMMEIMGAALAGSDYSFEIDWSKHPGAATPHGGQTYILIDPNRGAANDFADRIEMLIDAIHDAGQTRLPADRRYANRRVAAERHCDRRRRPGGDPAPGAGLTAQRLSAAWTRDSRTAWREAGHRNQRGWTVQRAETQRLKVPASTRVATPSRSRGQGSRIVYETLRDAILNLELEPGSPLDETSLSVRFDMSRSPIREALVRLAGRRAGDDAAQPQHHRVGDRFRAAADLLRGTDPDVSRHDALGRGASQRRADGRHPNHQKAFALAVERRDAIAMISSNRDFHVAIAEAGGNDYFTALFTRLLDEGRRILRLYYQSFGDKLPQQYVAEHDAIVSSIDAGDAELSDRLGSAHAAQIIQQIRSYLARETLVDIPFETMDR